MSSPVDLCATALRMNVRLLCRTTGTYQRWIGAADAFVAALSDPALVRMAAGKVGAWAVLLSVERGRHASADAAVDAFVAELAAAGPLRRPGDEVRASRGALLRALSSGDAERIDAALWALGLLASRAVMGAPAGAAIEGRAAR